VPELKFEVRGARADRVAAAPLLLFEAAVTDADAGDVHTVALRCQVRIEPSRRRYSPAERDRLRDLFGTAERWGQTLLPFPWAQVTAVVPAFHGSRTFDLPVPCSFDFSLAATKYFAALEGGELPLCFLFSGTVFYEGAEGGLQVAQIPWDREASFRLPAATWRGLMDHYYPDSAWLCLRRDVFDRLEQYRSRAGVPTTDQALERLLAGATESASPPAAAGGATALERLLGRAEERGRREP
jgi:hypothetical protein